MFSLRARRNRDVQALAAARLAALAHRLDPQPDDGPRATGDVSVSVGGPAMTGAPLSPGRHAQRDARVERGRLTGGHVTVIAVVIALASVVTGWHVLRSVPEPQSVELSSTRITSDDPVPTTAAGASSSPPSGGAPAHSAAGPPLVVDVTGRVRRPGIVEVPPGSRVIDALRAAGGARPRADTSQLNLARLLVDGEQIVVGGAAHGAASAPLPAPSTGPQATTPIVNINSASTTELEALPGVGPVTAAAIVEWRTQHGAFSTVDELLEVSGIGEATLAQIRPFAQL